MLLINKLKDQLSLAATDEIIQGHTGLHELIQELQREIILNVYMYNNGKQSSTARLLGISRQNLIQKLKTYGVLKTLSEKKEMKLVAY